jgi:putative hydrolase of the HAD superfamily
MKASPALLFDLGNVLLPIDLRLTYQAFSQYSKSYSADQIEKITHDEGLWQLYEAGLMDESAFRTSIKSRFDMQCHDSDFDMAFNSLLIGFHEGVYSFLSDLAARFDLYLLSNTSSIHANVFLSNQLGPEGQNVFDLFQKIFFSFEMGMVKPNPRIYQQVLEETNLTAGQVVFFDDNFSNIESANNVGIQAIHIVDPMKSLAQIKQSILQLC